MELCGLVPDTVAFVSILNACTHGGLVDKGLECFEYMSFDYKIDPQIEHYGCVIDLLGRAGRFKETMEVVKDMRIQPDEVVWALCSSITIGRNSVEPLDVLRGFGQEVKFL